jgi:nicotinamide-nucleotide amidase
MAQGALKNSDASVSISITGIAGPGGGSAEKPVGLVHFAAAKRGGKEIAREIRFGDIGRSAVRERSVLVALEMLTEIAAA